VRASEKQLRPPIGAEEARGRRYSDSPGALFEGAQFSALRMRFLRRRKCDPWCSCRCHAHTRLRTPQLLQTIIGQLFVGYAGFPALTGSCDLPDTCNGTAQSFVQLNYYFPPWFLARFVTLSLRISDFQKPEYSLRMLNVRSKFEPIFIGAGRNDAALLRSLIHNGKASVLDVTNDDGHSALHLAVKQSNVDAAKALLELGAEPYLENAAQEYVKVIFVVLQLTHYRTPYDMAWSTILCFQDTPNAAGWRVEEMKALFPSLDSIEERRKFTKIHKIINRILHCDLETELCRSRDLINQVDADGRTALSYAAARGDHVAVNTLLRYGADPNIADRIGQRPLRQSMKAFDSTCTNLLLQAGANVNYRDNWEQTALISSVFYPQPLPFTTALLLAGTDVNAVDFQGSSALMEAVKCNAPEAVQLLLDHQADVNVIDHFGMNIFMQGVRHNSHAALEVLLDSDIHVVHSVCDSSQKTVLHWAAEVGDIKTLQILTRSPLKDLSVHDKTATGLTAIDVAEKRLHMEKLVFEKTPTDTEWLTAFRDLLETIRVPTANQSPISPSGKSDISDDIFHDALQHLTFEERSGLAEEGGVQRPV
jgi:ankyrin repeat protein